MAMSTSAARCVLTVVESECFDNAFEVVPIAQARCLSGIKYEVWNDVGLHCMYGMSFCSLV